MDKAEGSKYGGDGARGRLAVHWGMGDNDDANDTDLMAVRLQTEAQESGVRENV